MLARDVEIVLIDPHAEGLLELGGYRFDTGPTVFTMPDLLRQAFDALGAEMDDFVTLKPVDPMYRATYHDGSELRVWHGRERMSQEIAEGLWTPASGPFDPAGPQSDPSVQPLPHDLQRAQSLLREAGFDDRNGDGIIEASDGRPFEFTLTYPGEWEVWCPDARTLHRHREGQGHGERPHL